MNPEKLIGLLNESCKNTISKEFYLRKTDTPNNKLCYVLDGMSLAINRFDIPQEVVKVLHWFNDFWLYFVIQFEPQNKKEGRKTITETMIIISLSVFQGENSDNEKYQLFRAEWDDYNDTNQNHAQPHWHITSSQAIENSISKYTETFEQQDFISLLESEKQKIFDVKKIHFAINGDWDKGNTHIHKIENEQQVVNWVQGLLHHLRTELKN